MSNPTFKAGDLVRLRYGNKRTGVVLETTYGETYAWVRWEGSPRRSCIRAASLVLAESDAPRGEE
jgi:hypothetical protein